MDTLRKSRGNQKGRKKNSVQLQHFRLNVLRYTTSIPEPEEECVIKTIMLKIPVLAKRPNGELIYTHNRYFVASIVVKKSGCEGY